ncbi:hypothetical protein H6P81_007000 [Aristolochia fimbriata]|uniref:Uncharacterized protein n=1 Tax=Aristolochia fimbriata TaxID=158543 RepID=A0AAV7F2M1_ARIFI|nr:hypothetical protein H6P81_007000 [Aristolochia fimbriata]
MKMMNHFWVFYTQVLEDCESKRLSEVKVGWVEIYCRFDVMTCDLDNVVVTYCISVVNL